MTNPGYDILVVDDHLNWRMLLDEVFAGYKCDLAEDIDIALAKLATGAYRLVCMNWSLKTQGDGRSLLQNLQQQLPNTPVVLLTAAMGPDVENAASVAKNLKDRYPNLKNVFLKTEQKDLPAIRKTVDQILGGRASLKVTWLHLSDLHIRAIDYRQDKVLTHLLEDIKRLNKKPNFIVITGDIAYQGQALEYKQAGFFFDQLLAITDLPKERLIIIPGNHDVNWNELNPITNIGVAGYLKGPDEAVRLFTNDHIMLDHRQILFRRLNHYMDFVNTYFTYNDGRSIRPCTHDTYFFIYPLRIDGEQITLIGLNSTWASALQFDFPSRKANDRGHLLLGEHQLDVICQNVKEQPGRINIGLIHHPFAWLQDFDRGKVEQPLRDLCHIILHGHEHEMNISSQIGPNSDVVIMGVAAVYVGGGAENGYGIVTVDLMTREGEIELKRYSPYGGGGWVPDTMSYPHAKSHVMHFKLKS